MRTCTQCKAVLPDDYVIEINFEDGSQETVPLTMCPECFKNRMRELALRRNKTMNTDC